MNPPDQPGELLPLPPLDPLPEWLLMGPHVIAADVRRLELENGRWVELPLAMFAGAPNAIGFMPVYRDLQCLREDFPGGKALAKIESTPVRESPLARWVFLGGSSGQYGPEGPPKAGP